MDYEDIRAIALSFPGVAAHVTYGTPSLKVGNRFLLRLREPGIIALRRPNRDERDMLLESGPDLFFITDHYRDHPYVLVRLDRLGPRDFEALFRTIWREHALKRHLQAEKTRQEEHRRGKFD